MIYIICINYNKYIAKLVRSSNVPHKIINGTKYNFLIPILNMLTYIVGVYFSILLIKIAFYVIGGLSHAKYSQQDQDIRLIDIYLFTCTFILLLSIVIILRILRNNNDYLLETSKKTIIQSILKENTDLKVNFGKIHLVTDMLLYSHITESLVRHANLYIIILPVLSLIAPICLDFVFKLIISSFVIKELSIKQRFKYYLYEDLLIKLKTSDILNVVLFVWFFTIVISFVAVVNSTINKKTSTFVDYKRKALNMFSYLFVSTNLLALTSVFASHEVTKTMMIVMRGILSAIITQTEDKKGIKGIINNFFVLQELQKDYNHKYSSIISYIFTHVKVIQQGIVKCFFDWYLINSIYINYNKLLLCEYTNNNLDQAYMDLRDAVFQYMSDDYILSFFDLLSNYTTDLNRQPSINMDVKFSLNFFLSLENYITLIRWRPSWSSSDLIRVLNDVKHCPNKDREVLKRLSILILYNDILFSNIAFLNIVHQTTYQYSIAIICYVLLLAIVLSTNSGVFHFIEDLRQKNIITQIKKMFLFPIQQNKKKNYYKFTKLLGIKKIHINQTMCAGECLALNTELNFVEGLNIIFTQSSKNINFIGDMINSDRLHPQSIIKVSNRPKIEEVKMNQIDPKKYTEHIAHITDKTSYSLAQTPTQLLDDISLDSIGIGLIKYVFNAILNEKYINMQFNHMSKEERILSSMCVLIVHGLFYKQNVWILEESPLVSYENNKKLLKFVKSLDNMHFNSSNTLIYICCTPRFVTKDANIQVLYDRRFSNFSDNKDQLIELLGNNIKYLL